MNYKKIDLSGSDSEVVDSLEKLGYIPISLRTDLLNRVIVMNGIYYNRAMQLFQRFDSDFVGNKRASPLIYSKERSYENE